MTTRFEKGRMGVTSRRLSGKKVCGIDASGLALGIVVSDYHASLADSLLDGALRCIGEHGGDTRSPVILRVPGAFEIPQAVSHLLARPGAGLDAIVTLGVLIRGETLHFEILAREVCGSLERIGISTGVPVAFGILTVDTQQQARDRAGPGRANKGWEAAHAALRMASSFRGSPARGTPRRLKRRNR
jgi:6,7-dimethyl-8-ribityllumazine synthase